MIFGNGVDMLALLLGGVLSIAKQEYHKSLKGVSYSMSLLHVSN